MTRDEIREISHIVGGDKTYAHFIKRINKEFDISDEDRRSQIYILLEETKDQKIGFCVIGFSPTKMKTWQKIFTEEGWAPDNFSIDTDMCFELMYMYIKPEFRNLGYGNRLFKKVLTFSKRKGAKEIHAYVSDRNDTALKFYLKQKAITISNLSDDSGCAAFVMWNI